MARFLFRSHTASQRARLCTMLVLALVLGPVLTMLPPPGLAHAATFTVAVLGDGAGATLRDRIAAAHDGDVIDFAPALAGQTIALDRQITITRSLTIQNSSGGTIAIDGSQKGRIFQIIDPATVTIKDIAVQRGSAVIGGGISINPGATLNLERVFIQGNTAVGADGASSGASATPSTGGQPGMGGGIFNGGNLNVTDSTFLSNQAQGGKGGSGIVASGDPQQSGAGGGGGLGAGLFNNGGAILVRTTFFQNAALGGAGGSGTGGGGGGAGLGGAIFHASNNGLTLTNVMFNFNAAGGGAGGVVRSDYLHGTGVAGGTGVTGAFGVGGGGGAQGGAGGFGAGGGGSGSGISALGNYGGGAGGVATGGNGGDGHGGGLYLMPGAVASIAGSTMAAGVAAGGVRGEDGNGTAVGQPGTGKGGGLASEPPYNTSQRTTIVAGNRADIGPDVFGAVNSGGANLIQSSAESHGFRSDDLLNRDPLLVTVAAPTGLVRNVLLAPAPGSPAIDAVPPANCRDFGDQPLTVDRRGVPRPLDGNGDGDAACDIGAIEVTAAQLTATTTPLAYAEKSPPAAIFPDLTVTNTGFDTLAGATVQIAAGFATSQDLLGFTSLHGIDGAFAPATGQLLLTGNGTVGDYQEVLRTVTYQNSSATPSTATRTVKLQVRSGGVPSMSASRDIAVTASNTAPTAVDDSYTTVAQTPLTVASRGVLANDTDVDSNVSTLTASLVDRPRHGAVSLDPAGGFTYTPATGFAGTDTFTYRASDGSASSSPATVTITVTAVACVPRPRVTSTPVAGGGKLNVRVEATPLNTAANNPITHFELGSLQNATVTMSTGQVMASGQVYALPANVVAVEFTVERVMPGQATTVPFTLTDGCGTWKSFVGGGAAAGF